MWNSIIQNILLLTLNQIVMKHSLLAANLFIIAAVMTSCQKEQSELTLESLPDKAVITGTVKYEVGDYQAETDGPIISNYQLPVSGQTVMVTIPTANYDDDDDDETAGNQYFEAVTDDNGNYRIEIPISTNTLTASIKVVPFYAVKTLMRNNAIVEIPNALYNTTKGENTTSTSNITLNQRDIKVVNLVATSASELPVAFDQEVKVNGTASVEAWVRNSEVSETASGYYNRGLIALERKNVSIKAEISVQGSQTPETVITVNTTTNSDGEYTVTMDLPTDCWDKTVKFTASVDASIEKDFRHYYYVSSEWRSQTIDQVIYEYAEETATLSQTNQLIPLTIPEIEVETEPVDNSGIYGVTLDKTADDENILSYSNNKLGWQTY